MSLPRRIRNYFRPNQPVPEADPLDCFRGTPAKLLRDFDILAQDFGLLATMESGLPIDSKGNPIPWFTYPAIEYLNQFDITDKKIFEYGCGHSTAYWHRRGAQVWAVDHDLAWFEKMSSTLPSGPTLYFADTEQAYATAINRGGTSFDIVVIDGVFRTACVKYALAHLRAGGFVILDNSERDLEARELLRQCGLFGVDFNGFGPINDYTWTTTIFIPRDGITSFDIGPPRPIGGNFA
jgi:hypothetical protein